MASLFDLFTTKAKKVSDPTQTGYQKQANYTLFTEQDFLNRYTSTLSGDIKNVGLMYVDAKAVKEHIDGQMARIVSTLVVAEAEAIRELGGKEGARVFRELKKLVITQIHEVTPSKDTSWISFTVTRDIRIMKDTRIQANKERLPKSVHTLDLLATLNNAEFDAVLSHHSFSEKISVNGLREIVNALDGRRKPLKIYTQKKENPTAFVHLKRTGGTTEQDVEKLKAIIAELGWEVNSTRYLKPNPEIRNGLVSLS